MANNRRAGAAGVAEAAEAESAPVAPIRISTKGRDKAPRVPLFELDGEVFTIPDPIPASYAAKFLKRLRDMGENMAAILTVDELLGPDTISALAECEEITQEEMQLIFNELRDRLIGSVSKALGN